MIRRFKPKSHFTKPSGKATTLQGGVNKDEILDEVEIDLDQFNGWFSELCSREGNPEVLEYIIYYANKIKKHANTAIKMEEEWVDSLGDEPQYYYKKGSFNKYRRMLK